MSREPGTTSTTRAPNDVVSVTNVRRLGLAVAGAVALVVLATVAPARAAGSTVNVATSSNFGTVLANAQGFALYTLPSDHNGMSTCTGPCVSVWPAVTVPAGTTPSAGTGVTGVVAAVLQSTGAYQVTYNGAPLYTFAGDASPGQVSGNNVGGFKVVQVSVASPPPTSPPTSSPPTATPAPTTTPPASITPTTAASPAAPAGPATAAGSSPPPGAVAPASSAGAPGAPTSLAFTGPGPALLWMVMVGAGLIALSLVLLLVPGVRRSGRTRTADKASRTGWWLLGR